MKLRSKELSDKKTLFTMVFFATTPDTAPHIVNYCNAASIGNFFGDYYFLHNYEWRT